jgi:hypothetical protein
LKTNDEKLSHCTKDALEAINVRREDALLGRTSLNDKTRTGRYLAKVI